MPFTRRQFLKNLGMTLGLAACSTAPTPNLSAAPTNTPTTPPTAALASVPAPTVPLPTITPTPALAAQVGLTRCQDYESASLDIALQTILDSTGFSQVVRSGMRVILKANLTGGAFYDAPDKPLAVNTYVTHPSVIGSLSRFCFDAGASSVTVVDGLGDADNWNAWGYTAMAAATGVSLVDLCQPDPYDDFTVFPVGDDYWVYPRFYLNPILAEADVLISVAKLKMHHTTGVTLSLKNLIGLAPIKHYRRDPSDNERSSFHDEIDGIDKRLPRVIIDLNRACPVSFALIDGILTCEGAAGPWNTTLNPVNPGLLVAGADPVAVDTVSAALMDVDPQAVFGTSPFLHGENHLTLANQAGLGVNQFSQIQVIGETVQSLRQTFLPVA